MLYLSQKLIKNLKKLNQKQFFKMKKASSAARSPVKL